MKQGAGTIRVFVSRVGINGARTLYVLNDISVYVGRYICILTSSSKLQYRVIYYLKSESIEHMFCFIPVGGIAYSSSFNNRARNKANSNRKTPCSSDTSSCHSIATWCCQLCYSTLCELERAWLLKIIKQSRYL